LLILIILLDIENPLQTNRFACVRSYTRFRYLSIDCTNLDCRIIENIETELSKIRIDIIQGIRKMLGHLNNF